LLEKHRRTLNWLSSTLLWQREFNFFQKLLDQNAAKLDIRRRQEKIDHFQNLILYYNSELILAFEKNSAITKIACGYVKDKKMKQRPQYFKEHDAIMQELESFHHQVLRI
jgi:hypothetical protein